MDGREDENGTIGCRTESGQPSGSGGALIDAGRGLSEVDVHNYWSNSDYAAEVDCDNVEVHPDLEGSHERTARLYYAGHTPRTADCNDNHNAELIGGRHGAPRTPGRVV